MYVVCVLPQRRKRSPPERKSPRQVSYCRSSGPWFFHSLHQSTFIATSTRWMDVGVVLRSAEPVDRVTLPWKRFRRRTRLYIRLAAYLPDRWLTQNKGRASFHPRPAHLRQMAGRLPCGGSSSSENYNVHHCHILVIWSWISLETNVSETLLHERTQPSHSHKDQIVRHHPRNAFWPC